MQDEYLDIVDSQDKVIGKKLRSEVYAEKLSNFRVINGFIENDRGELWIPRRSPHKKLFPLCLDVSVGGHVESGEEYDNAFKRETAEELNINTDAVTTEFLGFLSPKQNNVSAFMKVYKIKTNETPEFNKEDFVDYFWITPENLIKKIDDGEKTKSDLPKLVKIFFSK